MTGPNSGGNLAKTVVSVALLGVPGPVKPAQ